MESEDIIKQFYCIHNDVLFIKTKENQGNWKLVVPTSIENKLIKDYHVRYGHMGALKIVKALEERIFIKSITRKVIRNIRTCTICQMAKSNNERKDGIMIPITSNNKLEKVFLDICGPFPRSGGRHKFKIIVILFDHYTKYTKLYAINRATTKKILDIIINKYIPEIGKPSTITVSYTHLDVYKRQVLLSLHS